jgi:hypothetical protein
LCPGQLPVNYRRPAAVCAVYALGLHCQGIFHAIFSVEMKTTLVVLIIGLCGISECRAQSVWKVPRLQELTQADAIKNRAAHLSAEDVALLKQVTKDLIEDCVKDPFPSDPVTESGLFAQFRVRRVSLSAASNQGLVVQGFGACMCGAVGNCPFWIIGEGTHPRVLLETGGIQTFAFQKRQSPAHFDLFLGSHDSAMQTDLQRFGFDGSKYQLSGCAVIDWDDQNLRLLRQPRVTPGACP